MRLAAIVLAAFALSAVVAAPEVTPPLRISQNDIRDICRAVSQVTPHPVRVISPVSSDHYVPGAIEGYASLTTANGFKRVKVFERTDRVVVMTGDKHATHGESYELQKRSAKWTVLSGKGSWIE